jgi:hypothetical protein
VRRIGRPNSRQFAGPMSRGRLLIISGWFWAAALIVRLDGTCSKWKRLMLPVLILSLAICVTMFALGFGLLLPISSAFSAFAVFVGVAAGMVVLGLLFG